LKTAIILFFSCLIFSQAIAQSDKCPAEKHLEQAKANEATDKELALSSYLQSLRDLDCTTPAKREEIFKGIMDICITMSKQDNFDSAITGLMALVRVIRNISDHESSAQKAEQILDQMAMDLVLADKPKLAIEALTLLLEDKSSPPMRFAFLARAYLATLQFDQAAQVINRATLLYPDSPELLFTRASLAGIFSRQAVGKAQYSLAKNLLLDAERDLMAAIQREPDVPGIHRALGKIRSALWIYYRSSGYFQEAFLKLFAAEESYSNAANLDPQNPEPAFALGNLLQTAHDWIWAEHWYQIALERYTRRAQKKDISKIEKMLLSKNIENSLHNMAACLHNRALDAANTAHFELAQSIIRHTGRKIPKFAKQSEALQGWLYQQQQSFEARITFLRREKRSGDSQVFLGDLLFSARRYAEAEAAYQRALDLTLDEFTKKELEDRIYGTYLLEYKSERFSTTVGNVKVQLETPVGYDSSLVLDLLQKVHALTMSTFKHKLNGPLEIVIFPNHRAFLEHAGTRISFMLRGFYKFGRIATFQAPHRQRHKWLEILVHETAHRYVDELTYAKCPRWLSEGIALWSSQKWTSKRRQKFGKMVSNNGLIFWKDIEELFVRYWNNPQMLDNLYLQSHHMVAWLVNHHGQDKLLRLLHLLRAKDDIGLAVKHAFGTTIDQLESQWRANPQIVY
jgi:tetratricopeptide (TPR) repeat protein